MRYVSCLAAVVAALVAAPAFAGEGHVPPSTLEAIGLAGMETLSDAEGMEVRGQSGAVYTRGINVVAGLVLDPSTKNFLFGSDTNYVQGNGEKTCFWGLLEASHETEAFVALSLGLSTPSGEYYGALLGTTSGYGYAATR